MRNKLRKKLEQALPRNIRLYHRLYGTEYDTRVPAPLHNPINWWVQIPRRRGIWGYFRGWYRVGELDADADEIYLEEKFYERLKPELTRVITKAELKISVYKGRSTSYLKYLDRVWGPSGPKWRPFTKEELGRIYPKRTR